MDFTFDLEKEETRKETIWNSLKNNKRYKIIFNHYYYYYY